MTNNEQPWPGTIACPVCWDDHSWGSFTATYNDVTHRSQPCGVIALRFGITARHLSNPDVRAELDRARRQVERNSTPDALAATVHELEAVGSVG